MKPLSRRRFVATLPALALTAALGRGPHLFAASARPRVGCQANAFPLKPNDFPALLAALRTMRELEYTGFECNIRFVESEFDRVAEARKKIEDSGVAFIGVHTSMQLAKPEVFPRWVEKVAALGGTCVVMSGSGLAPDGNFTRDALLKKAASLNALGDACRRGGLRLAYHNHNPEFARQNAEMQGLAEETDPIRVQFLMDAGHARLGGGDPAAFLRRNAPRILGCHLKTYAGSVQVPLGQGDFGFDDLATAIKATGWSGWLITELGGGPRTGNTAALGPDRAYIRQTFGV